MGSPDSLGSHRPILILFDGVCNLCSGVVKFIVRRDPKGKFKFASLQSAAGRSILKQFNIDPDLLHSIVVIDNDAALERSDAAIHIASQLGGPWKLLKAFKIVPKFLRDAGYNVVAASRYRIFGKKDTCMIPTPELKKRFIEL